MSDSKKRPGHTPSRREVLRPAELLGIAVVLALFVGLITLMGSREIVLAGIGFGVAFIITLVVLAMFALTFRQNEEERQDIVEQDEQAAQKNIRPPDADDDRPASH